MANCRPIERDDEWLEIDVPEPGHGWISLGHWRDPGPTRWTVVGGTDLGRLLTQVRAAVLDLNAPGPTALQGVRVRHSDYRTLVPELEHAVMLAAIGLDRYQRLFCLEDQRPPAPLCASCSQGAQHQEVTVSMTCSTHGHRPFGTGEAIGWERAWERHQREVRWWESQRQERQS